MTITIDAEKAFHKIQHLFMIKKKPSPESGHKRNISQHYWGHIYDKPTANIILNDEKLRLILIIYLIWSDGSKMQSP